MVQESAKLLFQVPSNKIMFLSNILAGYNGIALLRTIDSTKGTVEIMVSPGCEDTVREIVESLNLGELSTCKRQAFFIVTMGCQMNEYDSEYMRRVLLEKGWLEGKSIESSDLIIVNTCTVRKKPELKALSLIGRLAQIKKKRPHIKIGMVGCLAEHKGDEIFSKFPSLDFLISPSSLASFEEIIEEIIDKNNRLMCRQIKELLCLPPCKTDKRPVTAYVSIMQGCNNYCTYCIVPFVRGPERSRDPDEIIREVELLVSEGVKEITLLGQNVNSYKYGEKSTTNFADLLRLVSSVPGLKRLRFTTSHPKDLSDELILCFKEIPILCDHIHLPVQAGSNKVLHAMGRNYTKEHYLSLVEKLRAVKTDIAITTDMMVGFPGETEEDFQETLDLVRRAGFDMMFSFKYSDREGTKAFYMFPKVPENEKALRLMRLQELQKEITLQKYKALEGKVLEVLVEGRSKDGNLYMGRTSSNKIVNFYSDQDPTGQIVKVQITEALNNSLRGRIITA